MKTAKDKKRHYTMKAIANKQTNCQDRVSIAKKALIFATMDETSDYLVLEDLQEKLNLEYEIEKIKK